MLVKFLAKTPPDQDPRLWSSLLADGRYWGDVEFTFDLNARNYDWLVVYEGLPPLSAERKINRIETLDCPRENTLLITTEPASIRIDGPHFTRQFGHILTHKHPDLVRHPGQIRQTPPLRWFYGRPMGDGETYLSLSDLRDLEFNKKQDVSTVCSQKQMSHTVHAQRYNFVMGLRERMPELQVFGRGLRPIDDKAEAMDDFRYHIAIENHQEAGHWTEKLSDCFLAGCLPFYFGDPNYARVFPKDAVIPLDIFDLEGAETIIRKALAENAYEQRQGAIQAAREIVLTEQNLMKVVADIVRANHSEASGQGELIMGRHIFRQKHPFKAAQDALFSAKARKYPAASPRQA